MIETVPIGREENYGSIELEEREKSNSNAKFHLVVMVVVGITMMVLASACFAGTSGTSSKFSNKQHVHQEFATEHLGKDLAVTGDIAYGGAVGSTTTYPFVVRLEFVGFGPCTGNILSRIAILTAAHCLDGVVANQVTVTAGQVIRGGNANTRQVRTASRLTQHANAGGLLRDIGIIEVDPPFDFTTSVNKITLGQNRPPVGTQVTAVGWGMNENDVYPNNLKSATTAIHTGADCLADAFEICTKGGAGSTCGGDSGGPLLWERNGVNELVAFNERSPTSHCSDLAGNVDIFESVPSYTNWIRDNMPGTIVYTRVTSKSCATACQEGGMEPLTTGTAGAYNGAKNYACSVPSKHDKRAGANIAHGSLSTSCYYGAGGTQAQASEYDCLCTSRQGEQPVVTRQNCKTACEGEGQTPIQTGTYSSDNSPVYVCAAVNGGSGYRPGWIKEFGSEANECMTGGGGTQQHQTTYKCVCQI